MKFPFGIKNLVEETLPDLRPKIKMSTSIEEAEEAAAKVEKEMINQIKEKAPEISKYFDDDNAGATTGFGKDGLGTIAEENASEDEEHSEEEDDEEDEEDDDEEEDLDDLEEDFDDEEEIGLISEEVHSGSRSRSLEDANDEEDEDDENSGEELSPDNEDLTQEDD